MSGALRQAMTLPEFLDWEERQEARFEFDGVEPVAMTGGAVAHEAIGAILCAALREQLRGGRCRAWSPTLKIAVQGRIRYPDAFVSCAPVRRDHTIVADPVIVFEVLSDGTSRIDRIEKLREYQATPSIQRYVILEQDSVAATVFARSGPSWIAQAVTGDATLELPEIGIAITLVEIYVDLDFGEDAGAANAGARRGG